MGVIAVGTKRGSIPPGQCRRARRVQAQGVYGPAIGFGAETHEPLGCAWYNKTDHVSNVEERKVIVSCNRARGTSQY